MATVLATVAVSLLVDSSAVTAEEAAPELQALLQAARDAHRAGDYARAITA